MGKRKMMVMGVSLFFLLGVVTFLGMTNDVLAKDYPTRPITLVVPYSPGGGSDMASKVVAQRISEFLGEPVVSAYKPGSGGAIGAAYVAKSKPDGYTLLVGSQTPLVISPLVKKKLGYTSDDLIPIVGYSKIPISFNVRADSPWKTLDDFVADAKKNPGKYNYSSYGTYGLAHLAMELFCRNAGIKLTHIPYAGSPKANAALLGGHVDIAATTGTGGLHRAGKLRLLGVAEKKRFPILPEVPTLIEQGYPVELDAQYAFCVPKGTPKAVIDKLIDAHVKAFEKYGDEMAKSFARVEQQPSFLNHKDINDKYNAERKEIGDLLDKMGIVPK